jgi:hypothetical protein
LSKKDRRKSLGTRAQKADPACLIRMRGSEVQVQLGNLPQKPEPEHEPHVPAQQKELENRNADKSVPVACFSEMQLRRVWEGIPSCGAQSYLAPPYPDPERIGQNQHPHFYGNRVSHAQR